MKLQTMLFKVQLLIILFIASLCGAYKILAVFPLPSKSHSILGDAHVRYLLEAGHEVTYITPFLMPRHQRLRQIQVGTDNYPEQVNITKMFNKEVNLNDPNAVMPMILKMATYTLANEDVQGLINDPDEQFDVVIAQWLFTQIYSGFAAVFDCPYIWSSSLDTHPLILSLVDEPSNPVYTTGVLSINIPPFTLQQRIQELWDLFKSLTFMNIYEHYYENYEYEKWFGPGVTMRGRSLPPFDELKYNASLILGNSGSVLGQSIRLPQNYKSIGGFHVDLKNKSLPEHLKSFVDNSKNGLIYFSLGSNLKSKDLPNSMIRNLLQMFGKLKYNVLWKFEESLEKVPNNVLIGKWIPQQSILSHPNCILFVTHGGLLSTTEALHFAKPLIGIPVYADQFINVDKAVRNSYAKKVHLSYHLADDLEVAIKEIVSDSRYAMKAKELSLIYHDRLVPPSTELVYWVEHVVRTRGAPHLRSPALMVPWYQKIYLDLLVQVFVVIYIVRLFVSRMFVYLSMSFKLKPV